MSNVKSQQNEHKEQINATSKYGAINAIPSTSSQQILIDKSTTTSSSSLLNENIDAISNNNNSNNNNNSSNTNLDENQMQQSTLTFMQKCGYGLGHVYNDLCAGVWFSYTLLFMQSALKIPGQEAGALVMLGQIGDALATPIIGLLADRFLTKRKWHIIGTGLVFVTFPLIFSICPGCKLGPIWWQPTYYSIVILLFQCGWAIVQISHLAMIPQISKTRKDRADLTAIRYSASVCSNVMVYMVTWAVLHTKNMNKHNIGPDDAYRFRDIALILTLTGITMTICFYFSLYFNGNQRRQQRQQQQQQESINNDNAYTPLINNSSESATATTTSVRIIGPQQQQQQQKNFLKSILLYQNALLYVFSRLFMTTSLIYIPLWLDERSWTPITSTSSSSSSLSSISVENIATVPLISFLSSFIASIFMKQLNHCYGHKLAYLFGSLICIFGCIWIGIAAPSTISPTSTLCLYLIAILFGTGSSITMISSLCITADMIGKHSDQSGFIYSAVTFADKLITGIVVIVIETFKCDERKLCPEYYRNVLSYACGTAAIFGLLTLMTLQCNRTTRRNGSGSSNYRHLNIQN